MQKATKTNYSQKIKKALALLSLGIFLLNNIFVAPFFVRPAQAGFFEFGIKDEAELGRQFDIMIRSNMPLVEDPEIQNYVNEMLAKLLKNAPPQPFDFKVAVLRHNAVNAFAAPGGYLFIHTGLIMNMENESELASVLAHEVAHATQRHIAARIEKNKKTTILSLVGALAAAVLGRGDSRGAGVVGAFALGQASMLSYSRADEEDADQVGFKYLTSAGYQPNGIVEAFKKIRQKQWFTGRDIPTYLSTHPNINERISELSIRVNSLAPNIKNRKDDNLKFWRIQTLIIAKYADPDIATQRFNKLIESGSQNQQCLATMGKGIVLARQNQIMEALKYFNSALACAPNDELIIREAGRFHYYKGDSAKAELYLKKAVAMNSRDIMAAFFYARLQADKGNLKDSELLFKEVLRYLPQDPEVHEALAKVLGANKQTFKAHLHLAYAYLYSNQERKYNLQMKQLLALAKSQPEKDEIAKIENIMKERSKFM